MKRRISSIALLSLLVIALAVIPVLALTVSAAENGKWTLVTNTSDLKAGDKIVIACNTKSTVAGAFSDKYLTSVSNARFSSDKKTIETLPSNAMQFTLSGSSGAWTITDSNGAKISWSGKDLSKNGTNKWSISISNGTASIAATNDASNKLQYNASSPRFKTYTSSQTAIQIYKLVKDSCKHENTTITTKDATCTQKGSVTTTCNDCGAVKTEEIAALGHDYVGGECFICGEAELVESGPKWQLTDIANIKATDVVVITMTKSDGTTYAIPHSNGSSSAPGIVTVDVEGEYEYLSGEIADEIKWNIANNNGTLTIYPNGETTKWLYSTTSNNGIRIGENTNKTWIIDAQYGYLQQTNTKRYLGVYQTQDWRSYTEMHTNIKDQTLRFYVLNAESKISGAQLQIDDTLAIKYLATLGDNGYDTSKLAMRFTYGLEGDKVSVVTESQKQTDGRYAFLFTGIAPQSMSDNIKAELIYDGVVIDTIEEYSVKDYAANIINKYASSDVEKHQKVVRLLSDMLHYGAEAQKYLGYNLDDLANAGVENILGADTNAVPENSDKGDEIAEGYTNVVLVAAGVRFDYNNKVYIKFDIDGIDINTVTVLVNGNEAEIVVVDGKYTVYTKGIKANEFDNVQTFEIFAGADLVVTATYSVNSYAYSKGNGETKIAPLAKAMYYYGLAAESYSANN